MIKIVYLIIGLVFTFAIPLGMLKLAILFAEHQEKLKQKVGIDSYLSAKLFVGLSTIPNSLF